MANKNDRAKEAKAKVIDYLLDGHEEEKHFFSDFECVYVDWDDVLKEFNTGNHIYYHVLMLKYQGSKSKCVKHLRAEYERIAS